MKRFTELAVLVGAVSAFAGATTGAALFAGTNTAAPAPATVVTRPAVPVVPVNGACLDHPRWTLVAEHPTWRT